MRDVARCGGGKLKMRKSKSDLIGEIARDTDSHVYHHLSKNSYCLG